MLEFLHKLFIGHSHEWEIIKEVEVTDGWGGRGTRYYLQCKKCGKVINKDII